MKSTKVYQGGLEFYAVLAIAIVLFVLLVSPARASFSEINLVTSSCSKSEAYCKGVKKYISGAVYEGEFKFGKEEGQGSLTWKDGSNYSGTFKNGLRNGYGVMVYADGSIYKGYWEKGLMHGSGNYVFSCGHTYVGNFIENEMAGQGTLYYATGDVYQGNMANNRPSEKGEHRRRDGSVFVGNFQDGARLGQGMVIWENGVQLSGNWDLNYLLNQSTFTFPSGLSVATKWSGGKLKKSITIINANGRQQDGTIDELKSILLDANQKGAALATATIYYGIAQEFATQGKEKLALQWLTKATLSLDDKNLEFKEQIDSEATFIRAIQKTNTCW